MSYAVNSVLLIDITNKDLLYLVHYKGNKSLILNLNSKEGFMNHIEIPVFG